MKPLEITSIQRGCVYDGEGVRTTIFLKGCPFSCPWCCNPETLYKNRDFFIDDNKCLKLKQIESVLCKECERDNGQRSIKYCPFGVYACTTQTYKDPLILAQQVLCDKRLFAYSNGGITFSGGEPLMQTSSLLPLLEILAKERISCALETTLYTKDKQTIESLITYIDEWIVDLKLQKENFREDYLSTLQKNLSILRKFNKKVHFRLVYIGTLNLKEVIYQLDILRVNRLELIKCHNLSQSKYKKLGLDFTDFTPDNKQYEAFTIALIQNGIQVNQLKL